MEKTSCLVGPNAPMVLGKRVTLHSLNSKTQERAKAGKLLNVTLPLTPNLSLKQRNTKPTTIQTTKEGVTVSKKKISELKKKRRNAQAKQDAKQSEASKPEPNWRDQVWHVLQLKKNEKDPLNPRHVFWIETRFTESEAIRRADRMNRCPTSESDRVLYVVFGPVHQKPNPEMLYRESLKERTI